LEPTLGCIIILVKEQQHKEIDITSSPKVLKH
jgi:hypothetical protein